MRLAGKVALMAGCSPNINAGIALGLAEEGAKIVCADLKPDFARRCAEEIAKQGGSAIDVACDVTNEEQVKATLDRARQEYGGVDVLVNGAVIQNRKGLLDMSIAEFRRQIDIILSGVFLFSKHTAQQMIELGRKGSIINIASTEGHQGNPGNVGYGTGKAGILNFTRSIAMELAPHGIRVNSLTPTGTDATEGLERAKEWGIEWAQAVSSRKKDFTRGNVGVPLGQQPSPRHYARAAVFLASEDAEMITGFDLRVDAGTVARYWRWEPGIETYGMETPSP
ncbi:MAG TPA: SDR family oxidoreductase [Chloroflexota bacterium]|nr:SDR family oxidoreductase [Chloroflexota bacterium]